MKPPHADRETKELNLMVHCLLKAFHDSKALLSVDDLSVVKDSVNL
jgi:hypothetical protein